MLIMLITDKSKYTYVFYMKAMESMHRHRVLSYILNQIHSDLCVAVYSKVQGSSARRRHIEMQCTLLNGVIEYVVLYVFRNLGKIEGSQSHVVIQQLLRVASTLMLKKAKNLGNTEGSHDFQIWWCINFDASGYRKICSVSIAVTYCVNFDAKKGKKLWQIFLMAVYMIFKYGKQFRCAPLFN